MEANTSFSVVYHLKVYFHTLPNFIFARYSAEELKYFPLNTAMFSPPKKMNNNDKEPEQESENHEEEVSL